MYPIYSRKSCSFINYFQESGKMDDTSATIATHGAQFSITVKIDHSKICCCMVLKKNQPIRTHSVPTMTDLGDQLGVVFGKYQFPIVYQDKVIARSVILKKSKFHSAQRYKKPFRVSHTIEDNGLPTQTR